MGQKQAEQKNQSRQVIFTYIKLIKNISTITQYVSLCLERKKKSVAASCYPAYNNKKKKKNEDTRERAIFSTAILRGIYASKLKLHSRSIVWGEAKKMLMCAPPNSRSYHSEVTKGEMGVLINNTTSHQRRNKKL